MRHGITAIEILIVIVITIIAVAAIRPVSRYVQEAREVRYNQAPQGGVHDAPPVENIYLLIGKRSNIPAVPVETDLSLDPNSDSQSDLAKERMREQFNWLNGNSQWIVIGPQTGRIISVENAAPDIVGIAERNDGRRDEAARNDQIKAAREFTGQTIRLGGR